MLPVLPHLQSLPNSKTLDQSSFNPFPNKPWFSHVYSPSFFKTMREKEKLLVTRNFSFSHSVFYPSVELSAIYIKSKIVVCKLFHFGRTEKLKYVLGRVENIMEKGYQQFLLFSQFFQNVVFIRVVKSGNFVVQL